MCDKRAQSGTWTGYVQDVWLCAPSLNYLCVTGIVLPWWVRTLPRLSGCAVPGCALAGAMVERALHVLAKPMVVPARREIASGRTRARRVLAEPKVVCARRKSNLSCIFSMYV